MDQMEDLPRGILKAIQVGKKNSKKIWFEPVSYFLKKKFREMQYLSEDELFLSLCKKKKHDPSHPLEFYVNELKENQELSDLYFRVVDQGKMPRKYQNHDERVEAVRVNVVLFYALIREFKPEVLIETGTAHGSMTSWIVTALYKNQKGMLHSIDLPPVDGELTMGMTVLPEDVGMLIPAVYRNHWTLHPGDAKVLLPRLMSEFSVDYFFHDSLHTRTHMLFEYNVARCLMQPGAFIVSDDILWNSSFFDFIRSHRLQGFGAFSNPNVGITLNEFDQYELGIGTYIR